MIGVTIPVLNHWDYTADILLDLGKQTHRPDMIVVVDDGSTDCTEAALEDWRGRCPAVHHVIRHAENRGVARSWNDGVAKLHGSGCDYIAVLNNDLVIPNYLLASMKECIRDFHNKALVGPEFTSGPVVPANWHSMADERHRQEDSYLRGGFVPGFAFMFHRSLPELLDPPNEGFLFEETLGKWWFEDNDLWMRCRKARIPRIQISGLMIHHYESITLHSIPDWQKEADKAGTNFRKKWGT